MLWKHRLAPQKAVEKGMKVMDTLLWCIVLMGFYTGFDVKMVLKRCAARTDSVYFRIFRVKRGEKS